MLMNKIAPMMGEEIKPPENIVTIFIHTVRKITPKSKNPYYTRLTLSDVIHSNT